MCHDYKILIVYTKKHKLNKFLIRNNHLNLTLTYVVPNLILLTIRATKKDKNTGKEVKNII